MTQEIKPLVTVVTVTFNLIKAGREKYFRQCLESVHNQTYGNIEHIVIDGASTDGTLDLIKEYADKGWIKYISEPDTGIYDAMNKGIGLANGKYIAFLNSDDFYHNPEAIKLSVEKLEEEQADFSYANFISINGDKKEVVKSELEKFLYKMPIGHPTMLIKKSTILVENKFNQKYKVAADYDLVIRLVLKDYKSVLIDEEITSYRYGGFCCTVNYSDEIAEMYIKNYAPFYKFSSADEAKAILYEAKLPKTFIASFRDFAEKRGYKNIDIEKVCAEVRGYQLEYEKRNALNDCGKKERHHLALADIKSGARKCFNLLLSSKLRQPVRKIWYFFRGKKIN